MRARCTWPGCTRRAQRNARAVPQVTNDARAVVVPEHQCPECWKHCKVRTIALREKRVPASMPEREPSEWTSPRGTPCLVFWQFWCDSHGACDESGWVISRGGFMSNHNGHLVEVRQGAWHDHPKAKPARPVQLDLFELVAS